MLRYLFATTFVLTVVGSGPAQATIAGYSVCTGAISCDITISPPNPVTQNPNNGILLGWDEVQNHTLVSDLRVDRVFDQTASFVEVDPGGGFLIKAGTIVSSHYFQWDPGNGSSATVNATIDFDSEIFAFITADQKLFDSDDALALPGTDYNDFTLRGLESGDTTNFNGTSVEISWRAGSPGDWTRLITAFSPTAAIPEPAPIAVLGIGLIGLSLRYRHKRS
ncbi:MAG: PEP-CTERM sorting domain-containing protein [Alphaproteobacteria bacterium]